jgi:translocation and assembly module TamB
MSQSDILSYIVLGAPLNQASINQQAQLSQAALSYALGSNNFSILEDLKKSFGIDNFNVGTLNKIPAENLSPENNITGTNNTAVFVGKQVNPRLYITYGLGLFNQEQELKTSYLLSSHWSFLTDTATSGNGADLVFTLDRDPSN